LIVEYDIESGPLNDNTNKVCPTRMVSEKNDFRQSITAIIIKITQNYNLNFRFKTNKLWPLKQIPVLVMVAIV
jgi:hypothetical protein